MCALSALGTAVACGGGTGEGGKPQGRSETPVSATATLTQSDLERVVVGKRDLKGFTFSSLGGKVGDGAAVPVQLPDVSKRRRVTPVACQPVADTNAYVSAHQPKARVIQAVSSAAKNDHRGATMALTAYAYGDAVKAMSELRTAMRECRAYTDPYLADEGWSYSDVKALPAPRLGDDAASYRFKLVVPGYNKGEAPTKVPTTYVVVRVGATIATFMEQNAWPKRRDKPAVVPVEIIRAQLKKLTRAGSGAGR